MPKCAGAKKLAVRGVAFYRCFMCGFHRERGEFSKDSHHATGYRQVCKSCANGGKKGRHGRSLAGRSVLSEMMELQNDWK